MAVLKHTCRMCGNSGPLNDNRKFIAKAEKIRNKDILRVTCWVCDNIEIITPYYRREKEDE